MRSKITSLFISTLFLLSISAEAAFIPTAATITVGSTPSSRTLTNLTTGTSVGSFVMLHCFSGGTANTVGDCTLPNSSSEYQVPAGVTQLRIVAADGVSHNASGQCDIDLMYGTASIATGTTDPAGAVRNGAAGSGRGIALTLTTAIGNSMGRPQNFTVPANDYVYISLAATNCSPTVTLYGYLE